MTTHADAPYSLVGLDPCLAPLDRADALRGDANALAGAWPQAWVLRIDGEGRAAGDAEHGPSLRRGTDWPAMPAGADFLGLADDGTAWFATTLDDDAPRIDLRSAAHAWPLREASAFATAHALHHWHLRHRYCGSCGGGVEFVRGGWLGRCLHCGREHYPRTDPAVIVAASDGERLLMGRQAAWPPRRHSVIAGFVEPGETLEQAVAREVMEETGIRITRCRYLGSQPWPMPTSLMLGFIADADLGEVACTDELESARWFTREEIVEALEAEARGDTDASPFLLPSSISIAHWLVREWLRETA
ncbi:NAD(+) diphosphatase [Cognatilysobacter segetis]|uniref:NAD(+) diphosphatase n=1 Tax=Cognatilysobacter segetis TaxID=2492394 RepID=UPI001060C939|nr:NAD(+) diphosphatase [Lysobacter segetis]